MPVRKLFLSVGAMKAGTTFLFNVLNRHPDIYFTPEKELHYFAHTQPLSKHLQLPLLKTTRSLISNTHRNSIAAGTVLSHDFRRLRLSMVMHNRFAKLQDADHLREIVKWYADRYLTDPVDEAWFDRVFEAADERYAADFSNYNCLLSDEGWDAVRRHCDKLRVVYVLRDPVARLWSHMKFEFIPAGKRDALVNGDKATLQSFLAGSSSAHARYGDILESLQRNLSKDEFKIIFLEDFIETFPQSIRFLEEFLELSQFDYLGINPERKANATENIYIPNSIANSIRDAVMPQLEKLQSLGVDIGRYHRLHNAEQITELERSLHRHKHLSGSS